MQVQEKITIKQLIEEFDLDYSKVPSIEPTHDIDQLNLNLIEFKKIIKKQYRKLALKYHPDHYPDKDYAHEKLIRLNKLMECVNSIKIRTFHRQPQFMTVRFTFSGGFSTSTSTTTGGTTGDYTTWRW